jgi:N-glycosylase/DNA lyase
MVITGVARFDPGDTLMCGQAFRWEEAEGGAYTGIAHGRRLTVSVRGDELTLHGASPQEYESIWRPYFALDVDYSEVHTLLATHGGAAMQAALAYAPGLRVMRQCPWEALVSFILSQNANIPRIRKMVAALCELAGARLPCGGYTFPTPDALAALSEADLAPVRAGYRVGYILAAARCARLAPGGQTEPDELQTIKGVGPKVAACALLYGYGRFDIIPMDVWMKRAMAQYYPQGLPAEITHIGGIAQQFLFHYVRGVSKIN